MRVGKNPDEGSYTAQLDHPEGNLMQSRLAGVGITIAILVVLNAVSYFFNLGWVFY